MTVEQMQAARTTTQADVDRITREHDQRYLIGDFAGLRFEEDDSPTVHLHPLGADIMRGTAMLIKSDDSAEAVYYDALTAADRCDQCAARAGVRVANNAGKDLTFCNHHWNDHHDALTASGFLVVLTGPGGSMMGNFRDIENVQGERRNSPAAIARAVRVIRSRALDDHDEQTLLTMIGIVPDPLSLDRETVRRSDAHAASLKRKALAKENS